MRQYAINKMWSLALSMALLLFLTGCHGSDHHFSGHHGATRTPTPTVTATTATATATPTATPTSLSSPMVVSSSPPVSGCGGQGVPTNRKLAVRFNQAMDPTTIIPANFLVTGPGSTPVTGTVTYDPTNDSAFFAPDGGLFAADTTFTAMITTGVESAAEVPLASSFMWTFKTSAATDTVKPTVFSTNPANLAPSVATNQKITAIFSEAMDSTTVANSTFTVTGPGATPVTGTVTYSGIGASATFTPTSPLATATLFTATIGTGVTDLAGNPLAAAFSWTFTSGSGPNSVAPTVTSMNPADGAPAVPLNAGINATFSKAMDPSTLNPASFTLTGPGPTAVAGKVTYDATNDIATFTPSNPLATGSSFIATITTGAKDLEGNPIAANSTWSFTAGSASSLLPVDLGAAAGFQAFAQATITNTGFTTIDGDIGLTPGTSVIGFPPGTVSGTIQVDNPPAVAALASLMTAYGDAAGRSGPTMVNENLAGQVLTPGLYTAAATSFEITGGNLTLDAQGDANAVWIFQMPASTLTLTTPTCSVILLNGAQFSNVFWQVGSSATIGAGCDLEGNILANTSITLDAGATMHGRALGGAVASSGAVTLSTNSVSTAGGSCNQ
jgi:hypothetical protein